jgi:adenylate cyclase
VSSVKDKNEDLQLRHMELLLDVSKQLAAAEKLDAMLQTIVEMTSLEIEADRGTLFLNDPATGELYSRIAQGAHHREIRVLNTVGIAGHVFSTNKSVIVHDAYTDSHFDPTIDAETGYHTTTVLCTPVRTVRGEVIGALQCLNKKRGRFSKKDLSLVEAMTTQAALALQSAQIIERMRESHAQEMKFLDVVSDVTSEIEIGILLRKVMSEATRMLRAERSTLFLNDDKTNELWSEVGEGLNAAQIRFPNHLGIAGAVFQSGVTINIPYAYADMRFNPAFDKQTDFFTRSILCVPVVNKDGKVIGVTQALNKKGGPFNADDESRLKAFTAQVSIALENAKLFKDIQNMKNYNESVLQSMSNGVITINEDDVIITCNNAGLRLMGAKQEQIIDQPAEYFFDGPNGWILDHIHTVNQTQESDVLIDVELAAGPMAYSVNITILPLISVEDKRIGVMLMLEDISSEKRMKSTMSRYMDPVIADQLMREGEDFLGGKSVEATLLFSDIRSFTTLTEELGAQGTVSFLNEYFSIMVDCVQREDGMLDKFIGDAIMAAFGMPLPRGDDEDRAVRSAISMLVELRHWNEQRAELGKKPVDIGIGINTGNVVSGNIGSPKRMDYTVIGDGVNLAARLESACKQYFAHILISEYTYKKLKGTYRAREIDRVVVKGKTEPVGVYQILDYHTDETYPNLRDALSAFRDGISSYRAQEWGRSIEAFTETLGLNPSDKLAAHYIERCELMKQNPPGDAWDGVWIMKSK